MPDRNRYFTVDDGFNKDTQSTLSYANTRSKSTTSGSSTGGSGNGATAGALGYKDVKARSADELAALYGVMNKREDIAGVLNQATEAKFGMWDQQTRALRDQQLTDYASQVSQMQQMQRQGRQNALRSGLSRGAAGAQEVLSQFYTQQQGNQNQQYYQQQLGDIAAQKSGQVGADIYNSMAMANEIGMGLGNLGVAQQTNEVQNQGNYWNYAGQLANANAMRYSADQSINAAKAGNGGMSLWDMAVRIGLSEADAARIASGTLTFEEAIKARKDQYKYTPSKPGVPPAPGNTTTDDPWPTTWRPGGAT